MKPIEMTLSAWGPFREEEKIDFRNFEGKGLFLIAGPTGSGKTTVFDGMTFALYGETSGEMRERESLRSDFSKVGTETYVNLVFSHNEKVYTIYRSPKYLRPKKRKTGKDELVEEKERARLILPDDGVIEGPREVNAKVQEILALDYRQFKQTTMLAQGEFTRLLYASPQDKTKIFRDIFGTTMYDKFAGLLKDKSKELYKEGKSLQDRMEEDIEHISLENETWKELTERESKPYEQIKNYLEEEKKNTWSLKKEAEAKIKKLDTSLEKLNARLEEAKTANTKLLEKEQVEESLKKLDAVKDEMEKRQERVRSARKAGYVEASYAQWQERKKALQRAFEKIEGLEKKKGELEEKQKELNLLKEKEAFYQELFEKACFMKEVKKELLEQGKRAEREEKELLSMQEKYKEKERLVQEKKELYERKDRERKRAAIGLAASLLEEGKPCPVCGSLSHPSIAKVEEGILSEADLEKLKKDYEKENEQLLQVFGETSKKKQRLEMLISQKEALLKQEKETDADLCKLICENEKAILFLEEDRNAQKGQKQEAAGENRSPEALCLLEPIYEEKKKRLRQLESELLSTTALLEDSKQEKRREEAREKETKKLWEAALWEQGFCGEEEFLKKRMEPDTLEEESRQLEQYEKELHSRINRKTELEKECKKLKKVDITLIQKEAEEERENRDNMLKEKERLAILWDTLKRVTESLKDKLQSWEAVQKKYGIVKGLEDVAVGNNKKRLVFEQYVLTGYFDEILEAANLRFGKMTGNRFLLERVQQVTNGRTKDNLEIAVFDYYTGKSRSVKTLSGGEAFKASLALSLGLSDVIQRSNGGIRVETLFVDEGFGSLDSESLDQAVKALYSLVEADRMIGIISHVQELRERISEKILVEKSPRGSRIEVDA